MLLGGVPGVRPADVVILGGGVAGTHAAMIAVGMGAEVTVVDRSPEALRRLSAQFGSALRTVYSTRAAIADLVPRPISSSAPCWCPARRRPSSSPATCSRR